jgi:hypothetical protein
MCNVSCGEVVEMRSRMWIASALVGAIASLALSAPGPLASRLEELARAADVELAAAIEAADEALASDPSSVAA